MQKKIMVLSMHGSKLQEICTKHSPKLKPIEEYFNLVKFVLRKFNLCQHGDFSYEDLFQEGCIGLWKAYKAYNPHNNVKFESYAIHRITGSIKDFLRRIDPYTRIERHLIKNGTLNEIHEVPIDSLVFDELQKQVFVDPINICDEVCDTVYTSELLNKLIRLFKQYNHSEVPIMKWMFGMKHEDIASRIGRSHTRITQILNDFRKKVDLYLEFPFLYKDI